ncbi:MAG: hypothetical protein CSA35_03190 [Dethiosulfovibrio peptidovorans]|nr:MAG: hypothetical protein CSA35_03190 [Dethiosulfovibrio peptidovorans]
MRVMPILCLIVLCSWSCREPLFAVEPATIPTTELVRPPKGDRVESERRFVESYKSFVDRRYWDALDAVDASLQADPYNVDCYLLRSLIRSHVGLSEMALQDLRSYLEVRPMDATVQKILSAVVKFHVDPLKKIKTAYTGFSQSLKSFLSLPPEVPTGTVGLRQCAALGDAILLTDQFADLVQVLEPHRRRNLPFPEPVSVVSLSRSRFLVGSRQGLLVEYEDDGNTFLSLRSRDIGPDVGDMALLSSSLLVVTRPMGRTVDIYDYPSLKKIHSWDPDDKGVFEPRAVAIRGKTIAVSDRNGDRICLFSWPRHDKVRFLKKRSPRSLVWGPTGDLLALSDDGSLSVFAPQEDGAWEQTNLFDVPDGMALFALDDRRVVLSSDGRSIMVFQPRPGDKSGISTLAALAAPSVDSVDAEHGLAVTIYSVMGTAFPHYLNEQRGVLSAVWKNKMKAGRLLKDSRTKGDVTAVVAPGHEAKLSAAVVVSEAVGVDDILRDLWGRSQKISQIVVDTAVFFSQADMRRLTRFCLFNGVSVSGWVTDIPDDPFLSMVENTGGRWYYAPVLNDNDIDDLFSNTFVFKIFYPQTVRSSGYPSKNMLSTIVDFGMISYRGWLPLWPDLL